jgi:hypothetical protein
METSCKSNSVEESDEMVGRILRLRSYWLGSVEAKIAKSKRNRVERGDESSFLPRGED